jgi:hypothetical protein
MNGFRSPTTASQNRLHLLLGAFVKIADDRKQLAGPTLSFDSPSEDLELSSLTDRTASGFDKSPVNTNSEMLGGLRVCLRQIPTEQTLQMATASFVTESREQS